MITFISATPGGGKTLTAVEILFKISKDNIKNLNFNYYLFKATLEKLTQLNLLDELRTATIKRGQGLQQKTSILFLAEDYFDFLKKEYYLNVVLDDEYKDLIINYPHYYFERVLYLNSIIERVNAEHNLKLQQFKFVRSIYTNINGLLLSQVRPLPRANDWRDTPFGSVIIYDEAQLIDIFNEESKKVDPIVRDLTIHRHKSYDIYFISQDPALVHKYIRKLCGHHIHLLNLYGFEQSVRFEWAICQEQPNALRNMARAEVNKLYRFPKQLYKVYISTTASTRVKRYPWKKFAIIGVLVVIGLYGASGLFSPNNALVSFVTGGKYGNEPVEKKDGVNHESKDSKPASAQSSGGAVRPSESATNQTANRDTNPINQAEASNAVSSNDSSVITQTSTKPSYDPSRPFDFVPDVQPSVVNHRVFSGCVSYKGKTFAVDQQGTKIAGFSASDCKKLLNNSYDRPFDYFGNRKQEVSAQSAERVSTSDSGNLNPVASSL